MIVFGELATVSNFGTMPVLQAIQVVLDFVEHLCRTLLAFDVGFVLKAYWSFAKLNWQAPWSP